MSKYEEFRNDYIEVLNSTIRALKEEAADFKAEGNQDGFVLGTIKANVVDIFQKMFVVSYNNVYVKLNNKNVEKRINLKDEQHKQLRDAYLGFFEEIPAPWKLKQEKDKAFGKQEEYEKEEEKLQMAERLKDEFIKLYKEAFEE